MSHSHPKLLATAVPGVQLLMAQYSAYRYDRHVHDTYSFGLTFDGVQSFTCRGARHNNTAGRLIAFNPDEAHDGQPGNGDGFAYAMLWVDSDVLGQCARKAAAPHFVAPTFEDAALARSFAALLPQLAGSHANESLLSQDAVHTWLLELATRHGRVQAAEVPGVRAAQPHAYRMREYLRAHSDQDVQIGELAAYAGVSRVHATRVFSQTFGIAPHQYLNSLRVLHAKRLIDQGHSLAAAAVASGYSDQAHMSKRFKASIGVSPGAYRAMTAA
jgi:AraC-like DNA-binding protein